MRKAYTFLVAFAAMLCTSLGAGAWSFDLPEDNAVLQGSDYGLELIKNYDFYNGKYNGAAMTGTLGDGCLTISSEAASLKLNSFASYQVQSPAEMSNFYIGISTDAINLRAAAGKDGLHNYGSGSRFFAIADVMAGQVIVCQWGLFSSGSNVVQPSSAITGVDACGFEDITDAVHAAQDAMAIEEGMEPTHDAFSYWRATSDGYFVVEMQRYSCIQGLQVWDVAGRPEFLTSPSAKVVAVDGTGRKVSVVPGVSSKGHEVTTWYTIDGTDPLFLEDSDEIERRDTLWLDDEHTQYNPEDIVIVYKKVAKKRTFDLGGGVIYEAWGENEAAEGDLLDISEADDEDGDGIVEVKIASVSSEGTPSPIVTINVSIGEIVLNTPTLTLVGMDGLKRGYRLDWTSNIYTETPHTFATEYDEQRSSEFVEGEVIWAADRISVTVEAEGYTSSNITLEELAEEGVEWRRLNSEKQHDWDFVNVPEDIVARIQGTIIDHYEVDNGDGTVTTYPVDAENIPDAAVEVYQYFGWDAADTRGRNWMHIDITQETQLDEDGNETLVTVDKNYPGDTSGLTDGLVLTLPSSADYSQYCIYLDNATGFYFMGRGATIEIPSVLYGQYVCYHVNGADEFVRCEAAEGGVTLSIPLYGYLKYIDIYTTDELPDGIGLPEAPQRAGGDNTVYSIDGRAVSRSASLNGLARGIYIMNGKKYVVK